MLLNSKFAVSDEVFYIMKYKHNQGDSITELCSEFNLHRNTVARWLKSQVPPSQCKTRKLSNEAMSRIRERRRIVKQLVETKVNYVRERFTPVRRVRRTRTITRRPYQSCRSIARALVTEHGIPATHNTVRADLYSLGKTPRKRRKGPYLDDKHRQKRVTFCTQMLSLRPAIRFSDECYVTTNEHGSQYVWVSPDEAVESQTMDQGPPQLLIWGMIGINCKHLVVITKKGTVDSKTYRESILRPSLKKLKENTGLFQQDNARAHCKQGPFFARNKIKTLSSVAPWPARSCDLSPIEQMWELVKRDVSNKGPLGLEELAQFIRQSWDAISMDTVNKLVEGFWNRCKLCVKAQGSLIKPPRSRKASKRKSARRGL